MSFEEAFAELPEETRTAVLDVHDLTKLVRAYPWREGIDKLADVIARYDVDEARGLLAVAVIALAFPGKLSP